ncbi:serine hydrolase domain-containing protein [Myroides odoratus]|uniref:serine hydrolase domain-containing protein n=1 Tax=Myroides odoratus TaxID=256 RepID=UPI00333FF760
MKKIFLTLVFNIFSLLAAQTPDYTKSIDNLMHSFEENKVFSGSVLLQKEGKTIYKGEFNTLGTPSDKYRVGSITEVFTAILIYQLLDEGKLTLETTLDQYYPTIKNADKITITHLLGHLSGIYNYAEWDDYYTSKHNKFTKKEMLALIGQGKPEFKPGQDRSYSNANYLLLGYIIEDITQKTYAESIVLRITSKIGLPNTYCETDEKEYAKRNRSYLFNGATWIKETDTHPSFTFSAGAIVSTTADLSKLIQELLNGHLISETSLAQMKKTNQNGLGYGLLKTPVYDQIGYGHLGNTDEFQSFIGYFPTDGLSIAVLSNAANVKINDVVLAIASKYFNKNDQQPYFTTYQNQASPSTKMYTGVYKATLIGFIDVGAFQIREAANNYLFLTIYADGKDGQKMLLERKGENKFYGRKNNANFDFTINKKGEVTGMKITQNKQSLQCKKVM